MMQKSPFQAFLGEAAKAGKRALRGAASGALGEAKKTLREVEKKLEEIVGEEPDLGREIEVVEVPQRYTGPSRRVARDDDGND
jgi:hypothetical protein